MAGRARACARARWSRRVAVCLGGVAVLYALVPPYPREALETRSLASTRIFDRHGALLYERRASAGGYGRWVEIDEIAPALIRATLSSEDAGFARHPGVDPVGVARALWLNVGAGRVAYGGSTITQQLAGLIEPRPRTVLGKLAEAFDALRLERALDKQEILTHYLNRAYYGRLAYGVEAAAWRFFGKPASALSLDEAALLAVLPRAPSAYDPARHPERAAARRAHVLRHMASRGWVDAAEAERAAAAPIVLVRASNEPLARHLLDHLQVTGAVPVGEPEMTTTLDLALQRRLEVRLNMHLRDVRDRGVSQAGIVVIDNASAEVLAMVGSRRYGEVEVSGAVNATTALRNPGSALKPFVYALALEGGDQPSTAVLDAPTQWRDYHPRAIGGRYRGLVSYRDALGGSLNIPAVRVAERVGIDDLARLLRRSGLSTVHSDAGRYGLALALGAAPVRLVDLAGAYAMLARGGRYRAPVTRLGTAGPSRRVLSAQTAYLVTHMLADPRARAGEFGLETPLELPFEAAVKTGTSQAFCDNVVVGYTTEVTVAVWVGNFDGEPMRGVLSMVGAAPLWRDAMLAAMDGRPRRAFARPDGIERRPVCTVSGRPRGPHCPHVRMEQLATAHVAPPCDWHGPEGLAVPPSAFRRGAEAGGGAVRITSPADGAVVVVDPLLPRRAQAVPLRASVASTTGRVRWEVDGEVVADVEAPFSTYWTPTAGRHRVRVIAGAEASEIALWVEVTGGEP